MKISISSKLSLVFFFVFFILSSLLSHFLYINSKNIYFKEIQNKLITYTELISKLCNSKDIKFLINKSSRDLTTQEIQYLENTDEYKNLYHLLKSINDVLTNLNPYIYIMYPYSNYIFKFIISSEMFEAKEISYDNYLNYTPIGSNYDISSFPVMINSYKSNKTEVENQLYYDRVYDVYSLSAYSPIRDQNNNLIALAGIDIIAKDINKKINSLKFVFFINIFIFSIISIIVSLILGKLITKTILKINQEVKSIADGNFDKEIIIKTNDEFEELSNSIETMRKNLLANSEKIRNQNLEMMKLLNLKDHLITEISKNIQGPIDSIQINLEKLVNAKEIKSSDLEKNIKELNNSINKIKNTIKKLLSIHELEDEINNLYNETVNIKELIEYILAEFEFVIKKKNIKIEVNLNQDFYNYHANKIILRSIFEELISNSLFYNKTNGRVFIRGYKTNDYLCLEIEDTGIGIKEEIKDKIFEEFFRGDNSDELNEKGAGLGLFIVKNFLKYYNGTIEVKSEYGKGSIFTVKLLIN